MPEDLLTVGGKRAIESARAGVEHLEALHRAAEQVRRAFVDEVKKAARAVGGLADEVRAAWRSLSGQVVAGKVEQMHTHREAFLAEVRARLDVLRRVHELARAARNGSEEAPLEADDLLADIAYLEKMNQRLGGRWRTADDLDYLVAEDLMPPEEKLEAVARKYGPTHTWTDEEKLF